MNYELLEIEAEMKRRKSKRDDLLRAFEIYGTLNTSQLAAVAGTGMSSRLKELKRKGWQIASHYVSPGNWEYTLLGNSKDDE